MRLLAFGGPINEQCIDVEDSNDIVLFNMPARAELLAEDISPTSAAFPKTITYRVEKVWWHDETGCLMASTGYHGDTCRWLSRCLVAEGYPKHRITDALNAIVGMTRILSYVAATEGA